MSGMTGNGLTCGDIREREARTRKGLAYSPDSPFTLMAFANRGIDTYTETGHQKAQAINISFTEHYSEIVSHIEY